MKGSAGESKYLNSICYFVSHELSNTNLSRKDAKPYVLLFLCLKLWHADHADFRRLLLRMGRGEAARLSAYSAPSA